jgi:hypothetical protein
VGKGTNSKQDPRGREGNGREGKEREEKERKEEGEGAHMYP